MKYEKKSLRIPVEIILEVCQMISQGNLMVKIIGSFESLGEVIIELTYDKLNQMQKSAHDNIVESVQEWNYLRYGEGNTDDILLH